MSEQTNDLNIDLDELDLGSLGQDPIPGTPAAAKDMSFIRNIPVNLTLEVASTELMVGDLMNVSLGTVIELDARHAHVDNRIRCDSHSAHAKPA